MINPVFFLYLYIFFLLNYCIANKNISSNYIAFLLSFSFLITNLTLWFHDYFFSRPISIISLNLNFDKRLEDVFGEIYSSLNPNNKIKNLFSFVKTSIYKNNNDCIFNLCEILPDKIHILRTLFFTLGYEVSFKKYSDSDVNNSYYYMLAWDKKKYDITFCEQVFFGEDIHKSMPVYHVKQKLGNKKIYLAQIHCDFSNENKNEMCNQINEYANTHSIECSFVVAGDWNCFDLDIKESQYFNDMFNQLQNYSYCSTFDLIDNGVTHTFTAYDYDLSRFLSKEEKQKINKKLEIYKKMKNKDNKDNNKEQMIILKQEIIDDLKTFISSENKSYIDYYQDKKAIGVKNLFLHKAPQHISESLITDMVIGWNVKKAKTSLYLDNFNEYISDHKPLITFIF
jgi:hypothetical protein